MTPWGPENTKARGLPKQQGVQPSQPPPVNLRPGCQRDKWQMDLSLHAVLALKPGIGLISGTQHVSQTWHVYVVPQSQLLVVLDHASTTVLRRTSNQTPRHGRHRSPRAHREHTAVRLSQLPRHTGRHYLVAKRRVFTGHTPGLAREVVVVVGAERVTNLVCNSQ